MQQNHMYMLSWWRHQIEAFLRYWPIVQGIHRSSLNSPHKGPVMRTWCFFDVSSHTLLNKQSNDRWFESTWRSCDVIVMMGYTAAVAWQKASMYIVRHMRSGFTAQSYSFFLTVWDHEIDTHIIDSALFNDHHQFIPIWSLPKHFIG